jgi:molecular chaperone GrpE
MFGRKQDKPAGPEPDNPQDSPGGYIPIDDVEGVDPMAGHPGESAGAATDELLANLRNELDDMSDRLKRTMADFQNYQRRALQNEQEARRQGASAVVMSVVPVLDHFDLALNQKAEGPAVGILEGVKVIKAELIRALERQGVKVISPAPNDVFDPTRHEAIMQQPAEGVEPGHISATFQPGFELNDRMIRSAKVAVAPV